MLYPESLNSEGEEKEGNEGISASLSYLPSLWRDKYILFLLWLTLIFFYSSRINEDAALQRINRVRIKNR